jgi:hypothetical protein
MSSVLLSYLLLPSSFDYPTSCSQALLTILPPAPKIFLNFLPRAPDHCLNIQAYALELFRNSLISCPELCLSKSSSPSLLLSLLYGPPAAPEAESKEKHSVRGPHAGVDYNLTYVHSRVDSSTFTMHVQPYARVDLKPMAEATLSPSQGLWIWPLSSD